ncbi:Na(+)-translocating NADH-quinone reductase subunit A [Posidoniimonas polymericola]|uniref:Na(+)-translocating NADH-quinone reductase subunit A n=1 Tax=Posidoniimonas polymericola TaxID=2528002 RepID=A0A5C5XWA0_9BACT|nr:Na(+)-translocating NADH-quinone reductase subunit A [Posidoniimonas polymericola]TWT67607.1 Na(+)-translocating NADH-quinone reductase subunit A [Posidoniimonas polymericola]
MTRRFELSKGLDIPLSGEPRQTIEQSPPVRHFALLGDDYIGMKPTMEVNEGDEVRKGQLLFTDKKNVGVRFTAPVAGKVVALNRGAKRKFESVVIEQAGDLEFVFNSYPDANLAQLPREQVVDNLVNSGLWTALRTRPFSKVPAIDSAPAAIFVTAIDTNPLAVEPSLVLADLQADFIAGLEALSVLTTGPTYLCKGEGVSLPGEDLDCVEKVEFSGPHPAGLVGTHIHMLMPAHADRTVWHIGYQDVAAVGRLMRTGTLMCDRVISIAGPATSDPRLVRTTLGANLTELTDGELRLAAGEKARVVSGSVLSGRTSESPRDFLGRYHTQVSVLVEGTEREFIGWMLPGFDKFSASRAYVGSWLAKFMTPDRGFALTTSTGGSHRAIVPTGAYDAVVPLDIVPTPLLKALAVSDTDTANSLGALEMDEEDLALCTFVCTSKNNYGALLRDCLTTIEREG